MKKGRVKSGEGNLIAASGEHFVAAELLKRGVLAALTPRNAPAFDILASQGETGNAVRSPNWRLSLVRCACPTSR